MGHHPVRHHLPAPPVQKSSSRLIVIRAPVFGALLAFSFLGLILTGCSGMSGSESTHSRAPSITTQPANQTVTAGQAATFTVAATGTAPLTYQWNKNGTAITGATSSTYTTPVAARSDEDRKSTRLNSNHGYISYAVFCLKKKKKKHHTHAPQQQGH